MMVAGKFNEYKMVVIYIYIYILGLRLIHFNNQSFVIADDKGDLSMYWLAHKNEQDICRVLEDDLEPEPNLESRSQEDDTVCYDNINHASGVVVKYVLFHYLHE